MAESSWGEGYVVDIDYTHGYFRELAPSLLNFVGLLGGIQSFDLHQPFTYYELGCGSGHSLMLHAAANPQGQFIGVDFNPAHIHTARTLAKERGVANVKFLEKSFAELLDLETPDADLISLHGVWSWISEENRQQITNFVRAKLQPGGLLYVSYNALPGTGQVAPLQRLMLDHSRLGGGDLATQMTRSIAFAQSLNQAGASYFQLNPLARARLDGFGKHDARYLAHEYFNENWVPFFHADVVQSLKPAKVAYAGSADIVDNFAPLILSPDLVKLIAEIGDKTLQETSKDFARNQTFRRDVFARGAPKASPAQLADMLKSTRFCLARPRTGCKLDAKTLAGEFSFNGDAYPRVLDALARTPMMFAELCAAPETAGLEVLALRQTLFTMAAIGNVLPALSAEGEQVRRASTDRHNRSALQALRPGDKDVVLASPVTGAGVRISMIDAQFLLGPLDEALAIAHFVKGVRSSGKTLIWNGKAVDSDDELRSAIAERAQFFFVTLLPWLKTLGIATRTDDDQVGPL